MRVDAGAGERAGAARPALWHREGVTRARSILLVASLVGAGCPEPPPAEPFALVVADGWTRVVDPVADVFADQRPADATCDEAGFYVDPFTQTFEVDTDLCDYLTVEQATLGALAAGDRVTIEVYHDDLAAPAPSLGYVGLALDGVVMWSGTAPIPSSAGLLEGSFVVERAIPAGATAQLHVHNHGANTWELVAVTATPGGGP